MVEVGLLGAASIGAPLPADNIDHARDGVWAAILRPLESRVIETGPFIAALCFTFLAWHCSLTDP